jgi:hypothetical protein
LALASAPMFDTSELALGHSLGMTLAWASPLSGMARILAWALTCMLAHLLGLVVGMLALQLAVVAAQPLACQLLERQ